MFRTDKTLFFVLQQNVQFPRVHVVFIFLIDFIIFLSHTYIYLSLSVTFRALSEVPHYIVPVYSVHI